VLQPFLDHYLKDEGLKDAGKPASTPPVLAFETGSNTWHRYTYWPQSCEIGCAAPLKPLYLAAGHCSGGTDAVTRVSGQWICDQALSVAVCMHLRYCDHCCMARISG
jgi:predicted acyl esterase